MNVNIVVMKILKIQYDFQTCVDLIINISE